eukprot:862689-Pleurochrysis_carterae.AAC.5
MGAVRCTLCLCRCWTLQCCCHRALRNLATTEVARKNEVYINVQAIASPLKTLELWYCKSLNPKVGLREIAHAMHRSSRRTSEQ